MQKVSDPLHAPLGPKPGQRSSNYAFWYLAGCLAEPIHYINTSSTPPNGLSLLDKDTHYFPCQGKYTVRHTWRLGQLPTEEYHRAINLQPVRGETLPRGRALSPGELRALFSACADGTKHGARDQALLAVLYGCGLRRAEAVGLDLNDYYKDKGELRVRAGKGNKQRLVYASFGVRTALEKWMLVRGETDGPLFLPITKGGRIQERRLTDQTVMDILLKRAARAGLKATSPHDFRRTFISDLLDAGADITTVQKLAGHANVTTTSRYDRRGETAKQKAADLLHVPVDH